MPIEFDMEQLRVEHNCVNYFETGLWDPRDDVSSKKALRCGFKYVFCVEIREDWVAVGRNIFRDEIASGRYKLLLDDSANMRSHLYNGAFRDKTMFFLDAHVDNTNIHGFKMRCPLLEELNAIKQLDRKDNVILVDDLRILRTPHPWGEGRYGNINFVEEIKNIILTINPNYKFATLNGVIENDVLLAYV